LQGLAYAFVGNTEAGLPDRGALQTALGKQRIGLMHVIQDRPGSC